MFKEGDVIRVGNASGRRVPEAVGFGMGGVANENRGN